MAHNVKPQTGKEITVVRVKVEPLRQYFVEVSECDGSWEESNKQPTETFLLLSCKVQEVQTGGERLASNGRGYGGRFAGALQLRVQFKMSVRCFPVFLKL